MSYPFNGGPSGNFGLQAPFFAGPQFGFAAGTNPTMGNPIAGNGGASAFPGIGSTVGGILPGIVLSTTTLRNQAGAPVGEGGGIHRRSVVPAVDAVPQSQLGPVLVG